MKNLRMLIAIIMSLSLMVLTVGCPDNDDNLTEYQIAGDSNLKVINDSFKTIKVYFDNNYIGDVNSDSYRIWNVPTGSHTIKVTAENVEDVKETYYFEAGVTKEIIYSIEIEYKNDTIKKTIHLKQMEKTP